MPVLIGHAASDSRGKYSGDAAGDQNGKEVYKRSYYKRPFLKVVRAKNPDVAEKVAVATERACDNENVGYDQGERTTLYDAAKPYGFDPGKVTVPCETDCSALGAVAANYAGIRVSKDCYSGNLESALVATGEFETIYSSSKESAPEEILKRGDVLIYPYHHVAIVLSDGNGTKNGFLLENGIWHYYKNGVLSKREWVTHNHHKYRMGIRGELLTGWHKVYDDKNILKWYYFEESGDFMGALWVSDSNGAQERMYID